MAMKSVIETMKRFAVYGFEYNQLTPVEKDLCTKEEFDEVVKFVNSKEGEESAQHLHEFELGDLRNLTPERGEECTRVGCAIVPLFIIRWVSKGLESPVFVFCCREHVVEVLQDHREDGAFMLENRE